MTETPGVLGASYLSDLGGLPIEDLRARRDRARQTETDLSYLRRIVQGRLDIVAAEQERRGGDGDGPVTSALPEILADDSRPLPRGSGVFVSDEPSMSADQEDFLAAITDVDLTDLGSQPVERLVEARLALQDAEAEISRARQEVHAVLDACAAELTRRYRDGEADVGALLLPPSGLGVPADIDAVLAEVVRSGFVEGHHHGSLVAVRPDGAVAFQRGEPQRAMFPRSSLKPLQAVAMLRAGLGDACALDARHLAIAASSHSGEQRHVDVVREVLALADVPEGLLECPHELPLDVATQRTLLARGLEPARVHHNCSGKHAAMLATCAAAGWPLAGYRDPEHPLQQAVRAVVEELAGPVSAVGVDGCGAPVFAVTLLGLARAYSRLVLAAAGTAEHRVAAAMREHPDLVGGTGRDVTAVMAAVPGLLAKDGAEGVYAAALADGTAVALKVADGSARARMPVLAGALARLGVPEGELSGLVTYPVLGGGEHVGEVRAVAIP